MLVSYKVGESCTLDKEVKNVTEGFAFIAYVESVFGTKKCGNCSSPNVRLLHRTPQGYNYYSVQCQDCNYELKFGQQKETGMLFPKGWEPGFSKDGDDAPKTRKSGSKKRRRPVEDEYEDDDDYGTESEDADDLNAQIAF